MDWVGPSGTVCISEASSRWAGVSLASSGPSRSKQGSDPLVSPLLVVARCRKGTPRLCASAGATTAPPAPYEADTVTSLARSELIASPSPGALRKHLPLILDEYRAHYNTHVHTGGRSQGELEHDLYLHNDATFMRRQIPSHNEGDAAIRCPASPPTLSATAAAGRCVASMTRSAADSIHGRGFS